MKPKQILRKLHKENPEAILWDDCDSALIGVKGRPPVAIYSRSKLVDVFVAQGMSYEDADEWVSFNIEGAYVGKFTPLIRQARRL